jgi:hypothetical protein
MVAIAKKRPQLPRKVMDLRRVLLLFFLGGSFLSFALAWWFFLVFHHIPSKV